MFYWVVTYLGGFTLWASHPLLMTVGVLGFQAEGI